MGSIGYFREAIETMPRDDLDSVIDERVRYTIQYAHDHSPFYRKWFQKNSIDIRESREHEDLLKLPNHLRADDQEQPASVHRLV
ncbi:hypothetical protein [Methanocalculus sp.]|uniref:hypothetical protein n=1 Tax=Methanocalculus sp. TaxID=2004547 RepID=UPI0034577080